MKLDDCFFSELLEKANSSGRKRAHYNLHQRLDEPVQRLCIALKSGTYVRPHHHKEANKWELMIVLKGEVGLTLFDESGAVIDQLIIAPGATLSGLELKPNTWHTVYPLSNEAIIIEVKEGPYTPSVEGDFAVWAPKEGEQLSVNFLEWVKSAKVGDKFVN